MMNRFLRYGSRITFTSLILTLCSGRLPAHTTRGHNVLEAAAYKSLLRKGKGDIPTFPAYSGKEILDYLIARQILRIPPCYPFGGSSDPSCANYTGEDSLGWLPVVGSGDMDAIFYRQFSKNGQYFHFMASPGAIYRNSDVDERTDAPRGLTEEAYPRAIRFITGMFYEILERSYEARRNYRDIYSLIHTVGDSYSAAHAERDTITWEINYLKPWQATAWQPYLVYWSGLPYFFSDKIHWFPEDIRDKQYLRAELVPQDEVGFYDKNPYVVPRSMLNARGLQGAEAIEDLLVTTFAILIQANDDQAKIASVATTEWKDYLNRHFRCTVDTLTINAILFEAAPADEQEWRPMTQIGVRTRFGSLPDSRDITLAMNFAKPPSYIDPFGFAAGYEIGKRTVGEQTYWIGSISFGLYLWQYSDLLALGIDPTIADLTYDGTHLTVEPMLAFFRFDTYISRRVWLSVDALRYSLINGFRTKEFSLTLGVAFSKDFPFHWTGSPKWYAEPSSPVGKNWQTPDLDSPLRLNPRHYGLFHPFGYQFSSEPQHISILPIGYTFLADIDRESKKSQYSYGLYMGAGGEQFQDNVWMFLRLGPVFRYKFLSLLALHVEPITGKYRIGLSKDAQGSLDANASLGFVVALGSLDILIEMANYSYKLNRLDQKVIAGIRFGILRE